MTNDHNKRNRASRDRLAAVIARLGDRSVALAEGWTAAGLLAHLAFWDGLAAARVEKYVSDRKPMEHSSDALTEFINAAGLPQWAATPLAVAADLATGAAARIDRIIEGLPKDAFDGIRAMNKPRLLDRSLHRKEHLDEIERALR
jgi:mycothiol maleylpyruvate isomerase-like protein